MRFSQLFSKTIKEAPSDEEAVNAKLLTRGGFVFKNSSGVYTFLPLGWRVINKISDIVREEMNAIGGQEMFMPALVDRKYMEATGRWDLDVGYYLRDKNSFNKSRDGQETNDKSEFVLGWSHEDLLTAIALKYVHSYNDLPLYLYQIQTKFRNEARSK